MAVVKHARWNSWNVSVTRNIQLTEENSLPGIFNYTQARFETIF